MYWASTERSKISLDSNFVYRSGFCQASLLGCGSGWILFFLVLGAREVILGDDRHDAVHLVLVRDRAVLQAASPVHADFTVGGASQNDRRCLRELDNSLGSGNFFASLRVLVPLVELRSKRVALKVPDLDTTVVSN